MRTRHRFFLLFFCCLCVPWLGFAQVEVIRYFHPVLSPPITSWASGTRGAIRALVVGVSRYQDASFTDLPFARRDAEAFAAFLKTPYGGSVPPDDLVLFTNEQATLAQVSDALEWLMSESRQGDKIVVYCAGYGQARGRDKTRLLFYDSPPAPTDAGFLALDKLTRLLGEAAAGKGARVMLYVEFRPVLTDLRWSGNWSGTEKKNGLQFEQFSKTNPENTRDSSVQGHSYNRALLGGLLGMADTDDDQRVYGPELLRYLKQWEKEHPATGNYAYLAFPYNDDWLCKARENARKTLGPQMESLFTPILNLEVQPLDQFITAAADSTARRFYEDFILTIRLGQLLTPPERCAAGLLDSLTALPALFSVRKQLQRRMAVAYQDETQQALNAYLQTNAKEFVRRRKNREHYKLYPQYLRRTIDILGVGHFMSKLLEAKTLYFEGLALRLEYEQGRDSALLLKAMEKQQHAIALEPEAAFVYNEMGVIHFWLKAYGIADSLFQVASEYSPTWSVPYSNRSLTMLRLNRTDDAVEFGTTAVSFAPWSPHAYLILGEVYHKKGALETAENLYRRALLIDPESPTAHYALAATAALQGQFADAIESLRKALQYGYDDLDELWADQDFLAIRGKPAFRELIFQYFPTFQKK